MITYFAYGSNMCTARLGSRIDGAKAVGVAKLPKHSLRWHKRSTDGSGKCDAFFTGRSTDEIVGVVYELADDQKAELDRVESLGNGYVDKHLEVQLAGRTKRAVLYTATKDAIDPQATPYDWYKEHVLCGAKDHPLPYGYVRSLEAISCKTDADAKRAAKERAIRNNHPKPDA